MQNINKNFIKYNRSLRSAAPIYIVVHDTGDPGATAQNEHDYFSGGDRGASADFFVDSANIIQIVDTDTYYSWHCGDGKSAYGISNRNSLGVEMCLEKDGRPSDATIANTVALVKHLMAVYNIAINHVVRHYDASRKACPGSFKANNWAQWYDFKDRVQNGSDTITGKWILDDSGWWYMHSDGTYTENGWEKIEDKWYLFNTEGYMIYDWKMLGDKWYYLSDSNNDGSMKTGWIFDKNDSNWYYCNESGAMQTGWQKIDGGWYYFSDSGAMQTGWIKDNGKDYCLYSNGEMVCSIDYLGYRFDANGAATKLS